MTREEWTRCKLDWCASCSRRDKGKGCPAFRVMELHPDDLQCRALFKMKPFGWACTQFDFSPKAKEAWEKLHGKVKHAKPWER